MAMSAPVSLDALDPERLSLLSTEELTYVLNRAKWLQTARDKQLPPISDWSEWGLLAGRGFGKTLTGANWIYEEAMEDPEALPSAVIAPTRSDVLHTCFEGPAGILASAVPGSIVKYNRQDLMITLPNGATIRGFSAEEPERLRGPQHTRIWCDELAAWQYADETWDMAMMGLRLGDHPKVLWTTTPKPRDIVRKLTQPKVRRVLVNGTTFENKKHLPDVFFEQLEQYEGTRLGRQELLGELIDPEESGIVKRSWLRMWPSDKPLPHFEFILMSLDTAFTEKTQDKKTHDPDHSACTVWGVFRHTDNKKHVLLLDAWQEQLGLPDLIKRTKRELNCSYGDDNDTALIKPMFGAAKPVTSGRKPDMLVIEDKGSGISLRQMLEREHILAYAYNPGRADKLTRLHVVSPAFARRFVWIPESMKNKGRFTTWSEAVIQQLCAFAGSGSLKHDDFVDSTTQAIRLLMDKGLIDMTKALKKPAEEASPPPKQRVNPYAQ